MTKQFDINKEFEAIEFNSKRLKARFIKTMEKLEKDPEHSILTSMGSRSEAKAVYRMLGNEKFSCEEIQRVHKASTIERMIDNQEQIILAVQDTTSVNYHTHNKTKGLGYNSEKTRGINVHSCLAMTTEGIALGILDQHFYTRENMKQEGTREELKLRPIEEKESFRWLETMEKSNAGIPESIKVINICDREGDMYELYEKAVLEGKSFLIRVTQNRYSLNNEKIIHEIKKIPFKGSREVVIPRNPKTTTPESNTTLWITYKKFEVKIPKRIKTETEVTMNVIYVTDQNEESIEWILATNESIETGEEAFKFVDYYIQRWKIERLHYILKSGCQIEKIQQRNVEQITPLIFMYSIISTMILNMTYLSRINPNLPGTVVLDEEDINLLYRCVHKTQESPLEVYTLGELVAYLGILGGFKSAKSDGPPGVKLIWNGLQRLYYLQQFKAFL